MPGRDLICSFRNAIQPLTVRFAENISRKRATTDETTIKNDVSNLSTF